MKYLTKEWFDIQQWSHSAPEVDDRAAVFSEEFFQEIYQQELEIVLKIRFEGAAVDFYVRQHSRVDVLEEDDFRRYCRELDAWMKALNPEECVFFDAVEVKASFDRLLKWKIEILRKYLPPEIMAKVADLRVLALEVGTPEIRDFFAERRKWAEQVSKASWESDRAYIESHPDSFAKQFYLHDARFQEMRWEGKDLLMRMESGPIWNKWVRFCDCEVVQMDGLPRDTWWLYEEFYEAGDKCEMHVLWAESNGDGRWTPLEMILRVRDVRVEEP